MICKVIHIWDSLGQKILYFFDFSVIYDSVNL